MLADLLEVIFQFSKTGAHGNIYMGGGFPGEKTLKGGLGENGGIFPGGK